MFLAKDSAIRSIYVAGPMRFRPYFNADAFASATTHLRSLGFDVISPAELDERLGIRFSDYPHGTEDVTPKGDGPGVRAPEDYTLPALMLRDLQAVARCDAVVTLPGWEHSPGAQTEVAFARFIKIPVFSYGEMS